MNRVSREAASKVVEIKLRPLALDDLRVPFYLLLGCVGVCLAAFLLEIILSGAKEDKIGLDETITVHSNGCFKTGC